jgi:hypothetical protein
MREPPPHLLTKTISFGTGDEDHLEHWRLQLRNGSPEVLGFQDADPALLRAEVSEVPAAEDPPQRVAALGGKPAAGGRPREGRRETSTAR